MVNTLVRDNDIGILLQAGATADISESKFFGNSGVGIVAKNSTAGTTTTAAVSDTVVTGSSQGIYAFTDVASAIARVEIIRSIVSNTDTGITIESQTGIGTASVSIRKSMVTGSSTYGLSQLGTSSTLISYGKNTLSENAPGNVFGTLTTLAPI